MKTVISLPDDLFNAVERLVQRLHRPRSAVYAEALREYVARHAPGEITESLDEVVAELGEVVGDEFIEAATRHTLSAAEW